MATPTIRRVAQTILRAPITRSMHTQTHPTNLLTSRGHAVDYSQSHAPQVSAVNASMSTAASLASAFIQALAAPVAPQAPAKIRRRAMPPTREMIIIGLAKPKSASH